MSSNTGYSKCNGWGGIGRDILTWDNKRLCAQYSCPYNKLEIAPEIYLFDEVRKLFYKTFDANSSLFIYLFIYLFIKV